MDTHISFKYFHQTVQQRDLIPIKYKLQTKILKEKAPECSIKDFEKNIQAFNPQLSV